MKKLLRIPTPFSRIEFFRFVEISSIILKIQKNITISTYSEFRDTTVS
jgi:hypothetical protein